MPNWFNSFQMWQIYLICQFLRKFEIYCQNFTFLPKFWLEILQMNAKTWHFLTTSAEFWKKLWTFVNLLWVWGFLDFVPILVIFCQIWHFFTKFDNISAKILLFCWNSDFKFYKWIPNLSFSSKFYNFCLKKLSTSVNLFWVQRFLDFLSIFVIPIMNAKIFQFMPNLTFFH